MNVHRTDDPLFDTLKSLLDEVIELRAGVVTEAGRRLERFEAFYPHAALPVSARNLAHYLALRQQELRPLQDRLARVGLSSLGRGESHVLANLDRIIGLLGRAVGLPAASLPDIHSHQDFTEGPEILARRTEALFGPTAGQRSARIMVTLPSEAATDYSLVKALFETGMDCARLNCAHDDPAAWQGMVDNIRRAEAEGDRPCKILMDLAGHKLRTGPIASGPAVKHLRVHRDRRGRLLGPARIVLVAEAQAIPDNAPLPDGVDGRLTLPDALHKQITADDRLRFTDTRRKRRYLDVVERTAGGHWLARCPKTAYVDPDTVLQWQRRDTKGDHRIQGEYPLAPFKGKPVEIRVHRDDSLLLTRDRLPGRPARHGADGKPIAPARIGCSCPAIVDDLRPGAMVWIDDGKLGALVESVTPEGALLRITHAGPKGVRIREDKGLNFPDTRLRLPPLSEKDFGDLDFVCRHADMVGFSFVETLEDMETLFAALSERDAAHLPIIAKIETNRAVRNLPELILGTLGRHPLGIMIARGDLAVELGSVRMAEIQEEILWVCEAAHLPVIWATQVLESLAKKGAVSRPEITDAAMSVRAECVMLNKGPYVTDAVRVLSDILSRMQAHQQKKQSRLRALHW